MVQQELTFFWSLTEQIPLDLDHSDCIKPKLFVNTIIGTNGMYLMSTGSTNTYISGNLSIDTDQVTFKTNKKPNIVQSMLYKAMGIKLEKK